MKENEWVSVKDRLPNINETVEVTEEGLLACRIVVAKFANNGLGNFSFYLSSEKITHPICWRYIPKKPPDFSKLNKGDLIIIEEKDYENLKSIGFFISHTNNEIILFNKNHDSYFASDLFYHKVNDCKKITRINLEDNTFEEI